MTQDPRRDLSRVLWLGGSTCAGKTSVARRLAEAHGLRVYHCDDAFEDHRRRARPERHPGFCRIMDLSGPELWSRPAEEQAEDLQAFYSDQLDLIVEDLRNLPGDGPLLVEGTGLLPHLVAALVERPQQALFLIAGEEFRRRLYPHRGVWVREMLDATPDPAEVFDRWMTRDDLLARRRAEQAAALGLPITLVDGSRTIEDTAAEVAWHFGLKESSAATPHASGTPRAGRPLRSSSP